MYVYPYDSDANIPNSRFLSGVMDMLNHTTYFDHEFEEVEEVYFLVEQRIHLLRHPVMGETSLFLVPIGPIRKVMRYEAVFA